MCGIVGLWNAKDDGMIVEAMRRMFHRGPDAGGCFRGDYGTLGHRRLSIMDPAGGDQPIVCERTGRAIVANGEIYNFPSLAEELSSRHAFRTHSDTESALHLYDELAEQTAARLDGMFAIALADGSDVYLARDAIGIKPLYYGRDADRLVFASEPITSCSARPILTAVWSWPTRPGGPTGPMESPRSTRLNHRSSLVAAGYGKHPGAIALGCFLYPSEPVHFGLFE